ncbi:hypothetical protein [Paenibacillus tyrfis]|uniref:hypothetical protein n=1 Tax=Paenibacillus tyrfis TaxID=1501230 RepID=UPI000B58EDEB|nr:hypothetical protein [Paenibacillus tyrfis]
MVTGMFQELFNKKLSGVEIKPYIKGEEFPYEHTSSQYQLIIFLSLGCSACIDFLPEVNELTDDDLYSLTIFIAGTNEEINALKEQLVFNCKVISISEGEKIERYKVPTTPYLYLLDKNMLVINSGKADSASDVRIFLKESNLI